MGMRSSDATFLRREVLPVLEQASGFSPLAAEAAERLKERLSSIVEGSPGAFGFNTWFHTVSGSPGDRNDADFDSWFVTLLVDQHEVPYIRGYWYQQGEYAGQVHLLLDNRFGIDTGVDELERWAPFLANAMAVSAGRTSHGSNSYVRNPHGRSGSGDPPEIHGSKVFEPDAPSGTR